MKKIKVLWQAKFPSFSRRGGRDHQENAAKPPIMGAAGVVGKIRFSGTYQPPRLRVQRWLRGIFLNAQPPLLGKEGNYRAALCVLCSFFLLIGAQSSRQVEWLYYGG